MSRAAAFWVLTFATSAVACSLVSGLDDFKLTSSGDGGSAGADASASSTSATTTSSGTTSASTGAGGMGGSGGSGGNGGVMPFCGDGNVDPNETCDDGAMNGTYNHCKADCSGMGPVCGDGTVDLPDEHCDDSNTVSGDGCASDCTYELSDNCPFAELTLGANQVTFMGNTMAANTTASGVCGGASSGDYILRVRPSISGTLVATLNGNYDVVVWLKGVCPGQQGSSLECSGGPGMNSAQFNSPVTADVPFYIGVDGYLGSEGAFTLTLQIQ